MSVVVAIKKNDRIYMGADTQTSTGDRQRNYLGEGNRKIHLLDNGILLGAVGSKRGGELLAADLNIFCLPLSGDLDKKHIVENIVPKIHRCFEENDLLENEENEPPRWACSLILAYRDKLFWIPSTGVVVRIEHFISIGSGDDLVYAGLEALDQEEITDRKEIHSRLTECLRTAAEYRCSVSAPFYLIDSEHKEYKLVK
jgi:ATP-dependent protease HslVU (ClpYQ) peptidase subunit